MKTMMVNLTDEEADHIEATARDQGLSPDAVLHDAVSACPREFPRREFDTPKPLGFIDIGASGQSDTSSRWDENPAGDVDGDLGSNLAVAAAKDDERPDLWFVGLFSGDESPPYASEEDPGVRRRIVQAIWEDSFGHRPAPCRRAHQ